jgi:hypothetical protein
MKNKHQQEKQQKNGKDQPPQWRAQTFFSKRVQTRKQWIDFKETEIKRLQMNITKEIWKGGKEEMVKLLQYVKEIELYKRI